MLDASGLASAAVERRKASAPRVFGALPHPAHPRFAGADETAQA
jgi:hypothetical protein